MWLITMRQLLNIGSGAAHIRRLVALYEYHCGGSTSEYRCPGPLAITVALPLYWLYSGSAQYNTVNFRYKQTFGSGGRMLITHICLYQGPFVTNLVLVVWWARRVYACNICMLISGINITGVD